MIAIQRYQGLLSLLVFIGLLQLPFLTGCASSSTKQLETWFETDPYQSLQDCLVGKEIMIILGDGTEHRGIGVLINAEVTSWQEPGNPQTSKVETSEVWKLGVRAGSNAGNGATSGFLIGAGFGFVAGATGSDSDADFFGGRAGAGAAIGLVFGLVGTLIGGIAGSTSSSFDFYVINPELAPTLPPVTSVFDNPLVEGL